MANRRPLSMALVAVVVLAMAAGIWHLARGGRAYVFRFRPADGTRFLVIRNTTVTYSTQGGRKWKQVRKSRTTGVIRRTASGYRMTLVPTFAKSVEDGVSNPLFSIYKGLPLYISLGRDGAVTHVRGLSGLEQAYVKACGRPIRRPGRPDVVQMMRSSSLEVARADWWNRIASLAGRKVRVGDVWTGTERYSSGGITVEVPVRRSVVGVETHRRRRCLVVVSEYRGDSESVTKQANSSYSRTFAAGFGPFQSFRITGEVRRVIAPDGLLIYRESRDLVLRTEIDDSISKERFTERERASTVFVYESARGSKGKE